MSGVSAVAWAIARAEEQAEFDPASVTPGVIGFAVTALFAVAVIVLGVNLVRRLRRSAYRSEIREALAAEVAEREADGRAAAPADPVEPVDPVDPVDPTSSPGDRRT